MRRAFVDHDFEQTDNFRAAGAVDDRDRELAARQKRLDQYGLAEASLQIRHRGFNRTPVAANGRELAAFAGAFGERLHERGQIETDRGHVLAVRDDDERRRRYAGVANHAFRDPLVERNRERRGVGKHVGLFVQFAYGGHLRFARPTAESFGDREHEVVAGTVGKTSRERAAVADQHDTMTETGERGREEVDRFFRIELRDGFFAVPAREVLATQVVDERDRQAGHWIGPSIGDCGAFSVAPPLPG